jgi:uncharacterized SAM-dependent methyltransferase
MSTVTRVDVHASAFPKVFQRDLLASLRARSVLPKLHYVSYKQAERWLAVHEAHSPARNDSGCLSLYDEAFSCVVAEAQAGPMHVVGLGCGGGQKEARLLQLLAKKFSDLRYTPCDLSLPLVLTATHHGKALVPGVSCLPLVCDVTAAPDLPQVLNTLVPAGSRVLTFFGLLPNVEPAAIFPCMATLARPSDFLLVSANLAPGPDYGAGVQRVMPGYDNPETRRWLLTFLEDLGIATDAGALRFSVEDGEAGLKRIVADYTFAQPQMLEVHSERFEFKTGETIRLFFSYRYTPALLEEIAGRYGFQVARKWITKTDDEGIFLLRPKTA